MILIIISVIVFCVVVFTAARYEKELGANFSNPPELISLFGISLGISILWPFILPFAALFGAMKLIIKLASYGRKK